VAELRELLHDAEEGLLGFDAVSPIKPFLGEGFGALSKRLEQVVFLRYRLPAWTPEEHAPQARRPPGRRQRSRARGRLVRTGGAQHAEDPRSKVLERDPLAEPRCCRPWEPWPPLLAAERFLAELVRLQRRIDEEEQASSTENTRPDIK
jgi:hypothetical protein